MYSIIHIHLAVRTLLLFCFVSLAAVLACSSQQKVDEVDSDADAADEALSQQLFDPDHLIEVEIEMEPDDWDTIRFQGRKLTDVMSGCPKEFEYTYKNGTVFVDGETFEQVAIRKKGNLGSLSRVRPSLKLNFRKNVEGRTAWGMKRMTLNNDIQDSSHTHQCMAYQLFRDAGAVAPRCNFAHVTVNGDDLGIYSHVESIKKPFLARHFQDNDGNLYEGQGADFHPNKVANFELKTNERENDRSDLDRLVKAMDVDDEQLFESLEEVIDMDAFLTHWAMEVITGHWDSYTGNQNNFYTYHDPTTDKFYFIPWGTDLAFSPDHTFLPPDIPTSVYAHSWPSYRLYGHPNSRAKYHKRLKELLDEVWDQEHLLMEVDRIAQLTAGNEVGLEWQREYIRNRKQMILDELESKNIDWTYRPNDSIMGERCLPTFNISGRFDTQWGDLSALTPSEQSYFSIKETPNSDIDSELAHQDMHVEEIGQSFSTVLVSSGPDPGDNPKTQPGTPEIWIAGMPETEGPVVVLALLFEPSMFGEKELTFHAFETWGAVVRSYSSDDTTDYTVLGLIGDGKVVFEEAGTHDGDPVRGSFEGIFVPQTSF